MDNIDKYLDGTLLYGDNFNAGQITEWYADEKEAYADLGAKNVNSYKYVYHALNIFHAYRYLPDGPFCQAMGFGSAYGDEFLPIISRIGELTIVDPSDSFQNERVHGVSARFIKPLPNERLPLANDTFDLITCLGVLHHIPNVTFVVDDLARVLKPGGVMLLREPIVSMGDWRKPRMGLTKRERGIPLHILENICRTSRLDIIRQSLCAFPLVPRMFTIIGSDCYNNCIATKIDAFLSAAFAWNVSYHARNFFQHLRPTSIFLILRKHNSVTTAHAPRVAVKS